MRKKIHYEFDNFIAKGGKSIFLLIVIVFVGVLISLSIIRALVSHNLPPDTLPAQYNLDFWNNSYLTFLELTDPGTMGQAMSSGGLYKLLAILGGLSGVVIFSTLIAFISNVLDQKIAQLKKGRSKVIESNHTVILGWDDQRVIEIIKELIIANESEKHARIVILAEKDKEEMDEMLRLHLPDTRTTKIITRSGELSSLIDLDMTSLHTAKSIIFIANANGLLSAHEQAENDAKTIQSILAVITLTKGKNNIAIIANLYNTQYASVMQESFGDRLVLINSNAILAKILVQSSRSIGLAGVYNEMLSFDSCELYFYTAQWGEITFGELSYHFHDGVVFGIKNSSGTIILNPDTDYRMREDDSIIILANDNSTIHYEPEIIVEGTKVLENTKPLEKSIEKQLILGWNEKVPVILEQYADYLKDGSRIDIISNQYDVALQDKITALSARFAGLQINYLEKDKTNVDDLQSIEPYTYDNIIIMAEVSGEQNIDEVDAGNIVTLLLLRNIFKSQNDGMHSTKLITEVLHSQNNKLIAETGVRDVVISNKLESMFLAQISENPDIRIVYDDLFQEGGSEIYIKPATLYFKEFPQEVTFADMIGVAQQRHEVCFGIKIKAYEKDATQNFGISLIPEKTQTFTLEKDDALVVLAENEL